MIEVESTLRAAIQHEEELQKELKRLQGADSELQAAKQREGELEQELSGLRQAASDLQSALYREIQLREEVEHLRETVDDLRAAQFSEQEAPVSASATAVYRTGGGGESGYDEMAERVALLEGKEAGLLSVGDKHDLVASKCPTTASWHLPDCRYTAPGSHDSVPQPTFVA